MKRTLLWVMGAIAATLVAAAAPGAANARTLGVEVWTDRGDDAVYQPGDVMQVKVRASDDAYLLVYEIDSDGRVSVLYPWRRGSNLVEAHTTYRLPPAGSGYELAVEKATGEGYIVAIASRRPFRDLPWYLRPFDPQGESMGYEDRHDDEEGFDDDGKVVGDPMVAMERIRRRVLDRPADTDAFATSYASYYVGHEVRYPRYLCNDCHRPGHWAWWDGFDPYYTRCSVFDFRVNWNWCWGPCLWSGHTPYYYYVVRNDCPPAYRGWYDDHSRWSSWDGYTAFNNNWGRDLSRRYKTPPPVGYTPPSGAPGGGKPAWNPNNPPPGYLPPSGNPPARRGFRDPIGIGRVNPPVSGERPAGGWRNPENPRNQPSVPAEPSRPSVRPERPSSPPPASRPEVRPPREEPRRESPREQPRREAPPRQDQPKQDRGDRGERGDRGDGGHHKG